MDTYDRLTMAIGRIQNVGHAQCTPRGPRGMCLVAALMTEEELLDDYGLEKRETNRMLRTAAYAMGFRSDWWLHDAVGWNDAPGRTAADVIARLDAGRDVVIHRVLDKGQRAIGLARSRKKDRGPSPANAPAGSAAGSTVGNTVRTSSDE